MAFSAKSSVNTCLIFISLLLSATLGLAHSGPDDPETKPNLKSKGLIEVKIWCLLLVFAATFLGGISPCFIKWNEMLLSMGTQFAGGVFLGTALMHFLSDSNETFGDLTSSEYPFAFMLCCVGYLLTMLADSVIVSLKQNPNPNPTTEKVVDPEKLEGERIRWRYGETLLLIGALCFHSVFEGIAIGVAESEGEAWKALWTISIHKVFAAVAMGITLLRLMPARPFLSCASYAFAFGISSPVGVGIGILIDATTEGRVADWIYAISMGIATGVFVFVAVNHLLSSRHSNDCSSSSSSSSSGWHLRRFLSVSVGVAVIAVVMIWDY
eukprot:TRINITY_DN14900_c0_g1_i1.p1 TRINITY_DN14900_c0_g1~~TRINITY_DN14900_c0_g1_i1.p1  ORF type:complete len:325 (+),score=30.31 TRINITY_DN14900_c0_g1_i1:112-1086(+)